ncbi:MAG: hypothetical protein MI892_19255 [Desulfobacterales bacterium]|nr:hypothetical protein [Desulfobacterales bacterium]
MTDENKEQFDIGLSLKIFFILEFCSLIIWIVPAALSAMAFDTGRFHPVHIVVILFLTYPLWIIICMFVAFYLKKQGKYAKALWAACLPPIISISPMFIGWFISVVLVAFQK